MMIKSNTTLTEKLQRYLILFAVVILSSLWIFQGFFLDQFYSFSKTREIKSLAQEIEYSYFSDSLADFAKKALEAESRILLINNQGSIVLDSVWQPSPNLEGLNANTYRIIFRNLDVGEGKQININQIVPSNTTPKSVLNYALKMDANTLLFIQSELLPVGATVSTIRFQLLIMSGIIIAAAIIIARRVSSQISQPIQSISLHAQGIAQGDYDTPIHVGGYQEIEQLSATLNQLIVDLKRVEMMRNELISNVSHDLRTPLTMIQGYIELMKDFPEERSNGNLNLIAEESLKLKNMIQNLLDLSRIQQNMQDNTVQSFEAKDWLKKIENRYSKLHPDRMLEGEIVEGDLIGNKLMLDQVLENLLNNALQHTQGRVQIITKLTEKGYYIGIKDQGHGIPLHERERIWDRYYSTRDTQTSNDLNYGLGLSIVKEILLSQTLEFGIEDNQGQGVTFYFIMKQP